MHDLRNNNRLPPRPNTEYLGCVRWVRVSIAREGERLRVSADGQRPDGERVAAEHSFTPGPDLEAFSNGVRQAAHDERQVDDATVQLAQHLHGEIFQGEVLQLFGYLRGANANSPLLVRLDPVGGGLKSVPWEALAPAHAGYEPLAIRHDTLIVRDVRTQVASPPSGACTVTGALAVQLVDPEGAMGRGGLRTLFALRRLVRSGAIQWLPPLQRAAAQRTHLYDRLGASTGLHALHFVGHGRAAPEPSLTLGPDIDGAPTVETVAQLAGRLAFDHPSLQLAILEACELACAPTDSAKSSSPGAQILAERCARAVIAHLWQVDSLAAAAFSRALYAALARDGNIAKAINRARRELYGSHHAAALSAVLYLRGEDPSLFDFSLRSLAPPPKAREIAQVPELTRLVRGTPGFCFFIGDQGDRALAALHERLAEQLRSLRGAPSLSQLAQRFKFDKGEPAHEFQTIAEDTREGGAPRRAGEPWIQAAARLTRAGVHFSFLRLPTFEQAIAEQHPERSIHVVQPGTHLILQRRGKDTRWSSIEASKALINLRTDTVVVRLYGGPAPIVFQAPLLTEDDYLREDVELVRGNPELVEALLGALATTPCLFINLSLYEWPHRRTLERLFRDLPIKQTSFALARTAAEALLWKSGQGVPRGIRVSSTAVTDGTLSHVLHLLAAGEH